MERCVTGATNCGDSPPTKSGLRFLDFGDFWISNQITAWANDGASPPNHLRPGTFLRLPPRTFLADGFGFLLATRFFPFAARFAFAWNLAQAPLDTWYAMPSLRTSPRRRQFYDSSQAQPDSLKVWNFESVKCEGWTFADFEIWSLKACQFESLRAWKFQGLEVVESLKVWNLAKQALKLAIQSFTLQAFKVPNFQSSKVVK